MEERMKIINNILEIKDENNTIVNNDIILNFSANKHSSKKNNIYYISFGDKQISKGDKYIIKYKCVTCNNIHIIGVTQFLRKINKCSFHCNLCYQDNENTLLSLIERHQYSIDEFEKLDDCFKEDYFKYHLTLDDYKRINKHLISLQNGKHIVNDKLEYWPIFKNGCLSFTSVFYDKENDMIIKANQPIMNCEACNIEWKANSIEKFKNCHRILCSNCSHCKKPMKIKMIKNNINQMVIYHSSLQMKFIKWCNNNNITIINDTEHKADFIIRDLFINVRGNKDIQENKRHTITPKNWVYMLDKIKNMAK
jgi:hypothetical protein